MKRFTILAAAAASLCTAAPAFALDLAPPPGYILDVGAITPTTTTAYTFYSTTFVANQTTTYVSFLFRRDPSYFGFDDASVGLAGGPNLLVDPGFELGPVGSQNPVGWGNFQQTGGIVAQGEVETGVGRGSQTARTGLNFWDDGAVGAYDGIYQQINTILGQTYTLSFWLSNPDSGTPYSQTGSGIYVLAYAGAALPGGTIVTNPAPPVSTGVPEPGSLTLLGLGALALVAGRRAKAKRAA